MKTLKSRFTGLWLCLACQHRISCCLMKYNSTVMHIKHTLTSRLFSSFSAEGRAEPGYDNVRLFLNCALQNHIERHSAKSESWMIFDLWGVLPKDQRAIPNCKQFTVVMGKTCDPAELIYKLTSKRGHIKRNQYQPMLQSFSLRNPKKLPDRTNCLYPEKHPL